MAQGAFRTMNRRSFIGNLAKVACFSILPGATTYARQWKTLDSGLAVPSYEFHSIRGLGYYLYKLDELNRQHFQDVQATIHHISFSDP